MNPQPPPPAPEQEPTWTRRDDKFLELLLLNRNVVSIHAASRVIGKTPDQMAERCRFLFAELRHVLEGLDVETPREWDLEIAATTAAPAAEDEEIPEAVAVPAAAPSVGAAEDSAAPTAVARGGNKTPRKVRSRKKKKPAEKWTLQEHGRFLAGLDKYRGRWQEMSREYVPTRTASQIASHYQKYRIREKQRERDECKRKSIHDITEPGTVVVAAAAAAAVVGLELPRAGASAPGEEEEPWEPVKSTGGEPTYTREDGFDPAEEFPGADDPGTLLT